MMMMDQDLAARIAARPAVKVTPDRIDAVIADTTFVQPTGTLTICVLTLVNGFTVTGESACASPENFDEQIGRELAFKQAREKIWALEGYALRERIMEAAQGGYDLNPDGNAPSRAVPTGV